MKLKPIQPLLLKLEETVSERLNQMEILQNHRKFPEIIKDEELKSKTRRNLRLIKQHELLRIAEEDRAIAEIPSLKHFSKENTLVLEEVLVKLMNKYLKEEFTAIRRGLFEDLIIIFQKYYYHINDVSRLRQTTVVRNQNIAEEVDFARKNVLAFVSNTRASMNALLNKERMKFYHASRDTVKEITMFRESPEKKSVLLGDTQVDVRRISARKKLYSNYVSEISKLLVLETGTMSNAAYFQKSESLDNDKKISIMETNFFKKNQEVKEAISTYSALYTSRNNS